MFNKLYIYASIVVIFSGFIYFWHYLPLSYMDEIKQDNAAKDATIKMHNKVTDKKTFEVKYKAVKDTMQTTKKDAHEEINTTIGTHRIIIK